MKSKSLLITLIVIAACAAAGFVLWPYAFTVVPIAQEEQAKQSEAFDAASYVDKLWESKIKPTVLEKAVDLPTILNEFAPDANLSAPKDKLAPIAKKYGLITVGEAHVYNIKGSGKVISVDTSKSTGIITIQLDNYTGPITVRLYIGSRIPSDESSVRDSVGFITFGDFKEQTEYGKVAAEINKRINTEILEKLDKATLEGKTITFYGAMTIRTFNLVNINLKQVNIVPVQIEVK